MAAYRDAIDLFEVVRAGPMATLQDAGRFGVRHQGLTQGGAADLHAWAWGNALLGNTWGAPSLEVVLGGLELVAYRDCRMAITGADLSATLDNQPAPLWEAFTLRAGTRLCFQTPNAGVRAYISVPGGFSAPPIQNSVATVAREQIGGLYGDGRSLAVGDRLSGAGHAEPERRPAEMARPDIPDYKEPATLALMPGAQIAGFTGDSLFQAFNQAWQVDDRADRMGVRLLGPRLVSAYRSMISEGINLGSVQVPPDGQPIALLNDRQTIGGYPRLGALTPLTASRLSQCLPGQTVRLRATGVEQAWREWQQFRGRFS